MRKFEINQQQVNVPTSWSEITLSDYEQWSQCDDVNQYLASICKVDSLVIETASPEVLEEITSCINFIAEEKVIPSESVETDGTRYYITPSDDIRLGTVMDMETINEEKRTTLLSDSLALLCKPLGEGYNTNAISERGQLFREQACDKMLPLLHYFYNREQVAQEILSQSVEMLSTTTQFLQESKEFIKNEKNMKQLSPKQRKKYNTLVKSLEEQLMEF